MNTIKLSCYNQSMWKKDQFNERQKHTVYNSDLHVRINV